MPSTRKGGEGVQLMKGGGTESNKVSNSQKVKPMANTPFAA